MSDLKYIQYLVERFLDGLTTIDEEREIASFIKARHKDLHSMPEDLQVVAEMFDELQAMAPPKRIRRMSLVWRWAAAAVTAAAAILGVVIHHGSHNEIKLYQPEEVLIVKMSRSVEPLSVDTGSKVVTALKTETEPTIKKKNTIPKKKTVEENTDVPSGPMRIDGNAFDTPARMPMMVMDLLTVEHERKELDELMLECEMKILEDHYQAYSSEQRTIRI